MVLIQNKYIYNRYILHRKLSGRFNNKIYYYIQHYVLLHNVLLHLLCLFIASILFRTLIFHLKMEKIFPFSASHHPSNQTHSVMLRSGLWGGQSSNGFVTATHPFRPIALSCLLTKEGRTETPVDFLRSKVRVEVNFLRLVICQDLHSC